MHRGIEGYVIEPCYCRGEPAQYSAVYKDTRLRDGFYVPVEGAQYLLWARQHHLLMIYAVDLW